VATALGITGHAQRPVLDALVETLRGWDGLLIVDNCEHLIQGCADLVDRLLGDCSNLHVLATSRESLGVRGEVTLLVAPLALPATAMDRPVDEMARFDAVQLFAARATAVRHDFR
jgi:non-specific serine/threonine protein kinase